MQIPDNYKVLFVQGGGNMQFAMVPMNLFKNKGGGLHHHRTVGKKAYPGGKDVWYCQRDCIQRWDKTFSYIPDCSDLPVDEDADYVYICLNNTIYGTKYHELPNTKGQDTGSRYLLLFPVRADRCELSLVFSGAVSRRT